MSLSLCYHLSHKYADFFKYFMTKNVLFYSMYCKIINHEVAKSLTFILINKHPKTVVQLLLTRQDNVNSKRVSWIPRGPRAHIGVPRTKGAKMCQARG